MGLFDRIWRLIRANFNSLVSQAEDPEKILEQTVMDMQEDLVQMRMAVAQAIATQKRTERQCFQAQSTAEEWYRRAQLALQKGDDALAREALTRRKSYQETAEAMQEQLQQQTVVVSKLKDNMRILEGKISEAKLKKDLYIARARSAQASQKIQEMLGQVNTSGALSAFERMEEKVLQLEASAEALQELGTDDLEKKFAALGEAGDIDAELAAMKAQMVTGTESVGQLAASEGSQIEPGSEQTQRSET
ncbi:MAG: PspA/IM30 family protein [Scytolyngbya sp. HA4215-MV1]|nr:PspA/IM30 family protein [Scytolyngbya sp. HA4215-MV1]